MKPIGRWFGGGGSGSGSGIDPSIVTAKGDLIVATGSGAVDNVAVGPNGTVLTADSAAAGGVKWAARGGPYQQTSGRYFHAWIKSGGYYDTFVPVAQRMYCSPFVVSERATFDRLSTRVGTGESGKAIRYGIYSSVGLRPDAVMAEVQVSGANAGIIEGTIDVTLDPGLYWLCLVANGTGTLQVRAHNSGGWHYLDLGHAVGDAVTTPGHFYYTGVDPTAGLPAGSSLTGWTEGHGVAQDCVMVLARKA